MFFKRIGRWGALCVMVLSWASCTVKENRTECPCLLTVEFTNLPPGPVEYRLEGLDGAIIARETVTRDTLSQFKVPRSGVRLTAVAGASLASSIQIPYGEECPQLYLFSSNYFTDHEAVRIEPRLRKHFCRLNLILDGPPGDGKPLSVMVRGNVNGLQTDGRPVSGEFRCSAMEECLLPRQAPSDVLLLDIIMEDNVIRTFALGSYLRDAGYDWTESDLDDITLTISLSVTRITFRLPGWSHTESIHVEI